MQILHPVPGPAECRTCRHFEPSKPTGRCGECRIGRPQMVGHTRIATWPLVLPIHRCGEHDRRLEPSPELPATEVPSA